MTAALYIRFQMWKTMAKLNCCQIVSTTSYGLNHALKICLYTEPDSEIMFITF